MNYPNLPHPKIIYSPKYDLKFWGIEKIHPFDGCKYSRVWDKLQNEFPLIERARITPRQEVSFQELRSVHTKQYLENLESSKYVAQALEFPLLSLIPCGTHRVVNAMKLATKGTILGAEAALEHKIAVNLSGGYHHASQDKGEGFCLYSDISIAIKELRKKRKITPEDVVLIIDLDAHQGNGLETILSTEKNVLIFDMYNADIYPQDEIAKTRIDCNIPLRSGIGDQTYLEELTQKLPLFIQEIFNNKGKPKIAFYNGGTDIYEKDPLGCLNVSRQGILKRDEFVFNLLTDLKIPWLMLLSGGYTRESYEIVADSVAYIFKKWNWN